MKIFTVIATIAAVVFGMLYFMDPLEKLETVEIPGEIRIVTKTVTSKPDTVIRTEFVTEFVTYTTPGDTVFVPTKVDTAAILEATGNSYFTSRKTVVEDYLHFELFAFGLLPADSMRIDYEINYHGYFGEHYKPLYDIQFKALQIREKKKRLLYGVVALVVGAFAWELAR